MVSLSGSQKYTTFEHDAVVLAAKKIASTTGDLRRALQICLAAAESVFERASKGSWQHPRNTNQTPIVSASDIQRASRDILCSTVKRASSFLLPFEALVLISVASLVKGTGRTSGGFNVQELMIKMESIVGAAGENLFLPCPNFAEVLGIINRLGEVSRNLI